MICFHIVKWLNSSIWSIDGSLPGPYTPTSLNQYYLWPVIHLVVSAGVFHIFLRPHKTQPRGWKEEQTNNMDLGQFQAQEREVCVTILCSFSCIRRLSRAFILRETSTKGHEECQHIFDCLPSVPPSADHPSPGLLSQSVRPPLLSVVDCSLWVPLSTAPLSFLGPSSPRPLKVSREISSSSPLFGFRAKKTKRSSSRRTQSHSITVVIAMKGYSTLPRSPKLVRNQQLQFSVIPKTLVGRGRLLPHALAEMQSMYSTAPDY